MNLLPVAQRELQLIAGQPRTYRARVLAATLVVLVSLSMLYAGFGRALNISSAGRSLFLILSALAAAYVLLDGVLLTADCLSQEKREGTLGLLFLTDLRGYDVVAGKLISRTASAAYCLLATLPALGIGSFLGGVTGAEFFHVALALLNGLFFAAAVGIFVSAVSRRERQALSGALAIVLSWSVLVPLLGWGLSVYQQTATIHPLFLLASPAGSFLFGLWEGAPGASLGYEFGSALALSHAVAWGLLIVASLVLPHAWREPVLGNAGAARRPRLLAAARRAGVNGNPLLMVDNQRRDRGLLFWPIFIVVGLGWGIGWCLARTQWLSLPAYVVAVALLHLGLVYAVALQACRGPSHDQRSGMLEILLTTPGGDDLYRRGRLLALKRRAFGPVLVVLGADVGFMVAGCWESGPLNWEWLGWIVAFVCLALKLLIDLYTVSWVGFWQGLKLGSPGRALRNTVFQVFLVRWILLMAVLAVLGAVTEGRLFRSGAGVVVGVVGYIVFVAMTALNYCGRAIAEVEDNLRELALGGDVTFQGPRAPAPPSKTRGVPFCRETSRPVLS